MECPSCRAEIREGGKFCNQCGAALPPRCFSCGHINAPSSKFCSECGLKLSTTSGPAPQAPRSQPAAAATSVSAAERRPLTVVFYDLVGSTALAARYDLEEVREIIGAFHHRAAEAVARFGGFVARTMGDGALVCFGYPQAHEDDAERAVRASFAVVEAVTSLTLPNGRAAQVRIGIASGLVVIGDVIGTGKNPEEDVSGDTSNLAARFQAIAEPNGIVISSSTRRLLGNLFECRDLGGVDAKGFTGPVQAWQVLRESPSESRFEALHVASALTPLLGREEEMELLLRRWQQSSRGEGQVVLISGEPGIGKSRLSTALQERVEGEPGLRLRYFCSPYHADSAFYPIIAHLERAAGLAREDTWDTKFAKLEALLAPTSLPSDDVTLLAELLSISTGRSSPANLTPQQKKQMTFEAMLRQLELLTRQQPVLMIFEDVHWVDPTTLELLDRIVERVPSLPVLLVVSFRPEFEPPWVGLPHVTAHPLKRLTRRQGAAMIEHVSGGKALLKGVVDQITGRTDGVPLFIEELTKAVLESGFPRERNSRYLSDGLLPAAVPPTLQASLLARLDHLGQAAKQVAQVCAAIGRDFSYGLLAVVAPQGEDELRSALDQLTGSGLVSYRGVPPEATYAFKHALIQEAAYDTLLRSKRQALHGRIVGALQERYPETVNTQPEVLAYHCVQAGLLEPAIEYSRRAGERAAERSANLEAIAHLRRGLELATNLPEGPDRAKRELELQVALGSALISVKGYAASETGQAYARAHELCQTLGDTPQRVPVLYGRYVYHEVRGEFAVSHAIAQDLLRLGEQRNDTVSLLIGHRIVGASAFYLGRFIPARAHLEQAIALYDPDRHRSLALFYGYDARVVSQCYLVKTLFVLGHADQALALCREALKEARELAPGSLAFALNYASYLHQFRREREAVGRWADELVPLAEDQGFPYWLAAGKLLRGWAITEGGDLESGLAMMRDGLAGWRATEAELYMPYNLALLAEAHATAGQPAEALGLVTEALGWSQRTGEHWFEAEQHRLKGELLRLRSDGHEAEAEECLRQALDVARAQRATSWELRAAVSLARLWRDQGRRDEARALLAPVYGWFTEGFDTPDLKEAKALLDELRE